MLLSPQGTHVAVGDHDSRRPDLALVDLRTAVLTETERDADPDPDPGTYRVTVVPDSAPYREAATTGLADFNWHRHSSQTSVLAQHRAPIEARGRYLWVSQ
jgi:hypothetical protein